MTAENAGLRNTIKDLEERPRASNREKANLQMAINLIHQVSNATGVIDVVDHILRVLVSAIGGTNISIYYEADGRWRYVDILGDKLWFDRIDDDLVKKCIEEKSFQKEREAEDSTITIPGFPKTYETWVYPLQVHNYLFGAMRLQGMAIEHAHYRDNIDPFIQYSALVLYHEISNLRSLQSAYQKVREAKEALQASEEKFSKAFNNAPIIMTISSVEDGSYIDVNDAFVQQTGYTREVALGSTSVKIGYISKSNRERMLDQLKSNGRIHNLQLELNKADGNKLVCLYSGELVEIEGAERLLSIAVNITEQRKYEMRLQNTQRMESIGNLAGGIAHDFNNILFPIIGMSELLVEDLPSGSVERENAEVIFRAGKRGSDLVKQILAFSRQSEQKKMPIRVQHILKEVMKLSRSAIPMNINITQDIQSDCPMVEADPTQVHQIAMNLITNAYHAVEPKSGEIAVRLRQVEIGSYEPDVEKLLPGRYALLSVSDTGVGIDPAIMEKIFEPYFTTKEKDKGTGLGLAVVYGIVKDHHGDIRIYSELEKGTTFNVYLPIMAQAENAVSIEGKEKSPTGHERILLVDDEEAIAKLERQMLERLGYKVTMRVNSLEALETFKTKPDLFDLVISDMTMPNMTGDRLAREMITIRPEIPIIICTGFSERLDPVKAASIGVRGFLMKPIVKAEMAKTIRKVLDEAEVRTLKKF
ncbi:MAG: ATP-binding protein [Pseudomonadota bacterium]